MHKNGMLQALMEEYQRATKDYQQLLATLSLANFEKIADPQTTDPDCKSIQTVTFHLVQSGHTYANYIRSTQQQPWIEYTEAIQTPEEGIVELDKMLLYTENAFGNLWQASNEVIATWSFETRWGTIYDIEQLMEHAIVHILRHRRQVEQFIHRE